MSPSTSWFSHFARLTAHATGRPAAFLSAAAVILVWILTGPLFPWSDTWQLVINTGTTIVTFLMVFLIQNTQNRDGEALQVKIDELIRAVEGARNEMIDLEDLEQKDLDQVRATFSLLARQARAKVKTEEEEGSCAATS